MAGMLKSRTQSWTVVGVPRTPDGRTFHVGVTEGECNPRILTVGDRRRAEVIAKNLENCKQYESSRGFLVISGTFKGTPVSIVAIGMGTANMDFLVREARAVCHEPMKIVRFGTCGAFRKDIKVGTVIVAAEGSVMAQQNFNAFAVEGADCYSFSDPIPADQDLSNTLVRILKEELGEEKVATGLNCTADSFYSSQGRFSEHFDDHNRELVGEMIRKMPNLASCEMESGQLLHLARISRGSVRATACCIAVANRMDDSVIDKEVLEHLEAEAGRAVLAALIHD